MVNHLGEDSRRELKRGDHVVYKGFAEAKFSGDAFRLFRWRSPDTRMQMYLETVLTREDHAKESKLFALGPTILHRYRSMM